MFTVDRLNSLLALYGGSPVTSVELLNGTHGACPAHQILDLLDAKADICTEGEYVGARLARHERFVARAAAPPGSLVPLDCDCGYCRVHAPQT
jgi:hypothetical protein